jgi:uncharacterized protein YutE (UPF0331/DUF86 family)
MNPEDIQDAVAGNDPILQMLRRAYSLLAGMPGAAEAVRKIISQPNEEWSMVIKFNAVFEAALIHVLTVGMGAASLEKQFERMTQDRRIAFADATGLIRPQQRRFLSTLNALRNQFAHRPKYIDAKVAAYAADLDENDRQSFRDSINALSLQPAASLLKLAEDTPATMIMVSALATLAELHDLKSSHLQKRERDQRSVDAWSFLGTLSRIAQESGVTLADLQAKDKKPE